MATWFWVWWLWGDHTVTKYSFPAQYIHLNGVFHPFKLETLETTQKLFLRGIVTVKARLCEIGHMVLGLGVLNPMYSHNKLVSCPIHPPEPGISADSNPKPSESSKVDFTQNRDCSALIGRNWPHGLSSRRISDLLG